MIIIDTGFWLALANKKDKFHPKARQIFQELKNEQFITTWPVITETCYLLQKRVGVNTQKALINKIATGQISIFQLNSSHCPRIENLMEKYRDLPMDLADASLVILAEELDESQILSVDYRDFNTYRWKNTEPFQNLLQ